MTDEITLRALDGSNPLAFLATLGTLRLAALEGKSANVQLRWERLDGFWRPILGGVGASGEGLCKMLGESSRWVNVDEFIAWLGNSKNITVSKEVFKPFVEQTLKSATADRKAADFAAAFGCEVCEEENNDRVRRTDFCFITGSGHQDFLGTMATLRNKTTQVHLYDALFGDWHMEKGSSMRWDPSDAAEYALQWDDPGPKGAWAVWGANRLAIEALPFFPTAPTSNGLRTTGFSRRKRRDEFTWPIWKCALDFASVRSLVALAELQEDVPEHASLRAMGVMDAYRAERVRIGQGANFKVSFRPARSV